MRIVTDLNECDEMGIKTHREFCLWKCSNIQKTLCPMYGKEQNLIDQIITEEGSERQGSDIFILLRKGLTLQPSAIFIFKEN